MPTTTPILGLKKPVVGADDDLWGGMLNGNMDIIDGLVRPVDLGPYLLKSGGTMTGALALAADANLALQPVSLQQMNAALALKPGEAPVDGRWYARRNNAWDVAPGSAINVDAPSDGFVYGRLNAGWSKALPLAGGTLTGPVVLAGDATAPLNPVTLQQLNTATSIPYLPLTGGIVTGPTTIMGAAFTAKQNLMLGVPEPATLSAGTTANGGVLRAWYTIANNYMTGMYWDGTNNRRLNAGTSPGQIWTSSGGYTFQGAAVGAADSIVTMTTLATMNAAGVFTATGYIAAGGVDGNGYAFTSGAGGVWVNGSIYAASSITCPATVQGNYVYSAGASEAAGTMRSYNGRIVAQAANNPGFCCHWPGNYAAGIILDGNSNLLFGQMDGAGNWVNTWGRWDPNANFWSYGAVTASYMHTTGSLDADGTVNAGYLHSRGDINADSNMTAGRIRATNGIMSSNGSFFIGDNDAYRLQRQSWDGTWVFYENNTWNFQIKPGGDANCRGVMYADGHIFSRNNVYASNDWSYFFGAGGLGRLFQFTGNWYFEWNSSTGQLQWVGNGNVMFAQRASDWLAWNNAGPVGGVGGYQNYSDRRVKEAIVPAKEGLKEILQLEPVEFIRVYEQKLIKGRKFPDGRDMPDYIPRREIGFIAQDVAPVLPQAVHIMGQPLPDGTGELYGPDPTLSLTYDTITTALVNAVKELNARLVTLEGRKA